MALLRPVARKGGRLRQFADGDKVPVDLLEVGTAASADLATSTSDATAGRVLVNGSHGVGGLPPILPTNDYNDLADYCGYARNNNALAAVNYPPQEGASNVPFAVQNVRFNALYGWQIGAPSRGVSPTDSTTRLYFRAEVNGAWSNWAEAWTSLNLVKTASNADTTAGRMLKVGDFGIGRQLAATEVNLDLYTAGGKYLTPSSGVVGLPSGWGQGRHLLEVVGGTSYTVQIIYGASVNVGKTAVRTWNGVTWSAWVELWDSGNLVKTASATDATAGRMLKVADFGIGGQGPVVADLNSLAIAPGLYTVSTTVNRPAGFGSGTLIQTARSTVGGSERFNQIITDDATGATSIRSYNGTFGPWAALWSSGNLVKQTSPGDSTSGSVLLVGAGGLLGGTALAISDYDTVAATGFYFAGSAAANRPPVPETFTLIHSQGSLATRAFQIANGVASGRTFMRTNFDGAWSAWVELWHSGNLAKTASATDTTAGRMLKVADFGIGATAAVVAGTTLDLTPLSVGNGLYVAAAADLVDPPFGTNAAYVLHHRGGASASQVAIEAVPAARMAIRHFVSGTWSAWKQVWTSDNLVKQSSVDDATAGAMLANGAWGMNGATLPMGKASVDLNTLVATGYYNVTGPVNAPEGSAATHHVFVLADSAGSGRTVQMAQLATIGRWFWRSQNTGTWSPWVEMWHDRGTNTIKADTGSIGYGTGSGGAVTQATSKSTAVTLNKPSGRVTVNAAALAAGASVSFQLNNSIIGANDHVVLSPSQLAALNYRVEMARLAAGACFVRITNITTGSLSETFDINFVVLKGAIA